jgi:predicted amidohydrolase YtcJ
MKNADLILKNAIVLTMDREFHQFEPGAVAIRKNKIAGVGPQDEILKEYTSERVHDCGGKVLMPGLVNATPMFP